MAYKNVVGARRAAWRVLSAIEQKHKESNEDDDAQLVKEYREQIEVEMDDVCDEVIKVINDHLVPNSKSDEGKVFYHKMAGDYYRYMCEYKTDEQRDGAAQDAMEAYQTATTIATNGGEGSDQLSSTHPIRLGLALNFSVFYYEIINKQDKACEIAKKAFDDAIAELDTLPEDSYKDATLIMQLLRDNLTLWPVVRRSNQIDCATAAFAHLQLVIANWSSFARFVFALVFCLFLAMCQ